jgi:hypothetical protein
MVEPTHARASGRDQSKHRAPPILPPPPKVRLLVNPAIVTVMDRLHAEFRAIAP